MKLSNSYFFTIRENIKDEDSVSGNLLTRGGFVRKNSAGVYMFLPLGLKVLNNIQNIVRDEMNKAGAQEVLMPALIPEETYVIILGCTYAIVFFTTVVQGLTMKKVFRSISEKAVIS